MKNIMWFSEISKANLGEVGGKGANLGEMARNSFPIPDGFVVTAGAYFKFLEHNKMAPFLHEMLDELDVEKSEELGKASERIKNKVIGGEIPADLKQDIINSYRKMKNGQQPYVAVRSSATAEDLPEASFAGQQATFLNVQGAMEVVQAVKECWASLFEARAIYYRVSNKFDHMKVGLAAVVQEMVQSEKSGVIFTVEPVTKNRELVSIEAAYGLGEIVVSGAVTPDAYMVNKKTLQIESKEIAKQTWMITKINDQNVHANIPEADQEKQKLNDSEIIGLAKIAINIEKHYGKPQDLEYAVAEGKLYIVQSRPITTLGELPAENAISASVASTGSSGYANTSKSGSGSAASTEVKTQNVAKASTGGEIKPAPVEYVASKSSVTNAGSTGGANMIRAADAKIIARGQSASPGVGRGPVKIILDPKDIGKMQTGDVLVTDMTTPDFVPAMKKAVAIVTNAGGRTCHAAIVSRELGVPCIVGSKNGTQALHDGQIVTVDAIHGNVFDGEVDLGEVGRKPDALVQVAREVAQVTGTKIYVNLAEVELADKTANLPCDGVGLLRAEFMIAGIGVHPRKIINEGRQQEFINKLADNLRTFASAFYPRPVVYRATDFKTNEYRNLEGGAEFEPNEANPMMGYRGCARYIAEPDIFKLELEAIKKVRDEWGMKNLWLMIPFVRRIGEIRAVKDILKSVGIHRTRDFGLWIMVEVPSTVFLIDDFCKEGIDGVSIGSNDLTQLILGIDRDNSTLADGFDERNAAVLKAIETVVKTCKKNGVTCSICGQGPSVYPDFAEKLVGFGITSMSVNPDAVERTRRIVASAEQKVILQRLAKLTEAVEGAHDHNIGSDD
ncbi:putative phosphoenolpyruvate synthase [Candidatus Anstonella stagnisolia]|nr:putative phosphoenolpyruvate synthase [Candidatus Anstonella stagnisolia]